MSHIIFWQKIVNIPFHVCHSSHIVLTLLNFHEFDLQSYIRFKDFILVTCSNELTTSTFYSFFTSETKY